MRRKSLFTRGEGFCDSSEAFFSRLRYSLRKTDRGVMENGTPADACGAIFLSSRALDRFFIEFMINEFGDDL
jgi:hypothetical protein